MTSPTPVPCDAINYTLKRVCEDLDDRRIALNQFIRTLQWVHVTLAAIEHASPHRTSITRETQEARRALEAIGTPLSGLYDATRQLYAAMSDLHTALEQGHTQAKESKK